MRLHKFSTLCIVICSLLFLQISLVNAALKVDYFTPSEGWAGSDYYNGTRVTIYGEGFRLEPNDNRVFFKDKSGNDIQSNVIASFPNESKYEFEKAIAQPGSAAGQIDNPTDIEIDTKGNIYVVSAFNKRIDIFDKDGKYINQISGDGKFKALNGLAIDEGNNKIYISEAETSAPPAGRIQVYSLSGGYITTFSTGNLLDPRGISIGEGNSIYVADNGNGKVVKFSSNGSVLKELTGPSQNPFIRPYGIAYDTLNERVYITDANNGNIYIFDKADKYLNSWTVGNDRSFGISVDPQGYVYVAKGSSGILKLDSKGKIIAESIGMGDELPSALSVAVDKDKKIFAGENQICQCIKVFSPNDVEQIITTIPPDSVTAKIKIQVGNEIKLTEKPIMILKTSETKVEKVEVTQGIGSYPFVAGKETLVYAELKGLFGAPGKDLATVCIKLKDQICITENFDEIVHTNNYTNTIAKYHVPVRTVTRPGQYTFNVKISRSGNVLYDSEKIKDPNKQLKFLFSQTEGIRILFVRFTDIDEKYWHQQNPFSYFDMQSFLYGLKTFKRVYPIAQQPSFMFGENKYLDFIIGGIDLGDKSLRDRITKELMKIGNAFYDPSGWSPDRIVGLLDPKLLKGYVMGSGGYNGKCAFLFFTKMFGKINTFGRLLAHEIGHNYGLVESGAPNEDPADKTHSINQTFNAEAGAPINLWNSMTDILVDGDKVYSIMAQGLGADDDRSFFESMDKKGNNLEYHQLFNKLNK